MGSYVKTDIRDPVLQTMDATIWENMFECGEGGAILYWVLLFVFHSHVRDVSFSLFLILATDDVALNFNLTYTSKYLAKIVFFCTQHSTSIVKYLQIILHFVFSSIASSHHFLSGFSSVRLSCLFLDASMHLYKRLWPSVGLSVGPSVSPSVGPSVGLSVPPFNRQSVGP